MELLESRVLLSATVGNFAWYDIDGNGQQDVGEPGLNGVFVELNGAGPDTMFDTFDDTYDSQFTINNGTNDGAYSFIGLDPGDYRLTFNSFAGFTRTARNLGPVATDSDAHVGLGVTQIITLADGEINNSIDAGYVLGAAIGDFVWNDVNADGIQDPLEPGIAGVTVNLYDIFDTLIATTTTDADGMYWFTNVTPGAYYLNFVQPPGFDFPSPQDTGINDDRDDSDADPFTGNTAVFEFGEGELNDTIDAGYYNIPFPSIGDFVWDDLNGNGQQDNGEPGINGVTVTLLGAGPDFDFLTPGDNTTDVIVTAFNGTNDGAYSFTDLEPGLYTLFFTDLPSGYVFTSPLVGNFETDSDVIDPFSGMTDIYFLNFLDNFTSIDAGAYATVSIGNFAWDDLNGNGQQDNGEPGINGVLVELQGAGADGMFGTFDDILDGQFTAFNGTNDGAYKFEDLPPGEYKLTFGSVVGYSRTVANVLPDETDSDANELTGVTAVYTLVSGEYNSTIDAGYVNEVSLPSVGDFVWEDVNGNGRQDSGEPGINGVTVTLTGAGLDGMFGNGDDTTDVRITANNGTNDGAYIFLDVQPGLYKVTFSNLPVGHVFTTANVGNDSGDSDADTGTGMTAPFTLANGDTNTTIDAGAYVPVSIGDFTWVDTNANGQQNVGEPGLNGVTVDLTGAGLDGLFGTGDDTFSSQLSMNNGSNDGAYSFTDLIPGKYFVTFSTVAGYNRTFANVGADETDSDAVVATGATGVYTLNSGESDDTIDAGYYQFASIGDYAWVDSNGNGQQNVGEPGLNGVTVQLLGAGLDGIFGNGDDTFASQVTANNGSNDGAYKFENLVPGKYIVTFLAVAGYNRTVADNGSDVTDSDANVSTGLTGIYTLVSGQFNNTVDAGYYQFASIGNYTWVDSNGDGQQNVGEPGLNGVQVTLTGAGLDQTFGTGDDTSANTVSFNNGTNDGAYIFTDLVPGDYKVTFGTAPGYTRTVADTGPDATDSDANVSTGMTAVYALASGLFNDSVDAGYILQAPGIDIEKTTNGPTNANPTAPDYDNEDAPNGPGVPILTPGSSVTWTYKVSNTGSVSFLSSEVFIVDDSGTPGNTSDDLSTTNGQITFLSVQTGDADNILEPGEVWLYRATGTVQNLTAPSGSSVTLDFSGSSALDGPDGNVRMFSSGAVSVKSTAFSREKGTSGAWSPAWLGQYGGGLGVTDSSEGSGSNDLHTIDNVHRDNYVLFAFDQDVIVDSTFLGYVVDDSDIQVWIGTISGAYGSLPTLSDSVLASLGFTEVNLAYNGNSRLADINNGNYVGNVLIIAADTTDTTPEDRFKIEKVTVKPIVQGVYQNTATITVPGGTDSDLSHYTNPTAPPAPGIDIEKTTNGPSNSNPTAPDYDNEDTANGVGVPILTPGSSVLWTYKISNTGNVAFPFGDVVIVDNNGTLANTADDFSTTNGQITFLSVQTGDGDNILEPGEVWLYQATGIVQTLSGSSGSSVTLDFSGNSSLDGSDGNVRTFSAGSVSVRTKAFSREKGTNGSWSSAYLGSYGGGLGVTDSSEGSGSNNMHTVDNVGRDNYVLFAFDQNVIVDSTFLGYVVNDSDIQVWIGTISGAFGNLPTLSDSVLAGLGFTEVNLAYNGYTRLADINNGNYVGNVLIIAADTTDTSPEDRFKIEKLTVKTTVSGVYENKGTVTVPGDTDSDLSHYTNSVGAQIDYTKFYVVNSASTDKTYEYTPTGELVESYAIASGNTQPRGVASTIAGDTVWVVDANQKVYVYDTSGGLMGSWQASGLSNCADVQDITTDGTDVWIVDAYVDRVYKYAGAASRLSGSVNATSSFALNSGNTNAKGLVTDGASIWVVNDGSTDKVFKYAINGAFLGSWTIGGQNVSPTGITINPSDVSTIWIVDSSTCKVYEYDFAATRVSGSQNPAASFQLAAGNTCPQGIADPPPVAAFSAEAPQNMAVTNLHSSIPALNRVASQLTTSIRSAAAAGPLDVQHSDLPALAVAVGSGPVAKGRRNHTNLLLSAAEATESLTWLESTPAYFDGLAQVDDLDAVFSGWETDPLELLAASASRNN